MSGYDEQARSRPFHFVTLKVTCSAAALSALLALGPVYSQDAEVENDAAEEDVASLNDQIVIFGNREKRIVEVSNPFTVIDARTLELQAPRSVADALINVPSLHIDPSSGATNNQFRFRGIGAGGTQFLEFEEDGIPIQRDAPDFWYRVSNGTAAIDTTRGGVSPIYRTAAIGAIVNFRNKEGARDSTEGDVYFQASDYGQRRAELFFGGPLTDQLTYSLSGVYSQDEGIREVDFLANDGFSLFGSLKYHFEDESGHVKVSARHTNEDNLVYLGVPLQGDTLSPSAIPGGPDINNGSLISRDIAQFASFAAPGVPNVVDNTPGEGTDFTYFGTEVFKEFGNGVELTARNRYTDSSSTFSGYFAAGFAANGPDIQTGSEVAANLLSAGFPSAGGIGIYQQAFGPDFAPVGYRLQSTAGVLDAGTLAVTDLNGDGIIDNGEAVATSTTTALANGNGLFLPLASFTQQNPFTSFQQDIELSYDFSAMGAEHRVAGGYYYMRMERKQDSFVSIFLTDLQPQADRVDLILTSSDGGEVPVTSNGALAHNIFPGGFDTIEDTINAYYGLYEGIFGPLTFDGGIRYDQFESEQAFFGNEPAFGNGLTQTPLPAVGTTQPAILAIQQLTGPNSPNPDAPEIDEGFLSGTVGANYLLWRDQLGLYARFTSGGLPTPANVSRVEQIEAGTRWSAGDLQLAANLFYINQESDNVTTGVIIDGENQTLVVETDRRSIGLEVESEWSPFDLTTATISATYQDPELVAGGIVSDLETGASVGSIEIDGNRVPEQPRFLGTFGLAQDILLGDRGSLTASATVRYVGGRFVDFQNTAELDDYVTVGIGLNYENDNGWYARINAQNLTNEEALQNAFGSATAVGIFTGGDSGFYGRPLLGRNVIFGLGYRY